MSTIEAQREKATAIHKVLSDIAAFKVEDLLRRDFGPLNFDDAKPYIERIIRLFTSLQSVPLEEVPVNFLNEIEQYANQARTYLGQIRDLKLDQYTQNPRSIKEQYVAAIRDNYPRYFQYLNQNIAYVAQTPESLQKSQAEAARAINDLRLQLGSGLQEAQKAQEELKQYQQQLASKAKEVGVSEQAIHFKQEADDHRKTADGWLWATSGLFSATFLLLAAFVMLDLWLVGVVGDGAPALSVGTAIQVAVLKITLLSVMLGATIWAGRVYRAHRHNFIVNKHRQNALSTFREFTQAATEPATKNAVLLQATSSIFAPQPTGYSSESDSGSSTQLLEIIRETTSSSVGKT